MKTFKLTVTEDELRALIQHNAIKLISFAGSREDYSTETSERIHNLTKRLNKNTPEIEGDPIDPPQAEAAKDEQQNGW